jgi:ATP-dependent Clp protease ATP-binding subunit ClpC
MLPSSLISAIRIIAPVLALERWVSHARRRRFLRLSVVLFALCFTIFLALSGIFIGYLYISTNYLVDRPADADITPMPPFDRAYVWYVALSPLLLGLCLLLAALSLKLTMLEAFYFSHYVRARGERGKAGEGTGITLEAAEALFNAYARGDNPAHSFLVSRYGSEVLRRLELSGDALASTVAAAGERGSDGARDAGIAAQHVGAPPAGGAPSVYTLRSAARDFVWEHPGSRTALQTSEITEELFLGAASWVAERSLGAHEKERWWSPERLRAIGVVGDLWSYGGAYRLRRYAKPVSHAVISDLTSYGTDEALALESVLARSREANALLVGDDTIGMDAILSRLAARIASGEVADALRHNEFLALDVEGLIAATGDKATFERECVRVFEDAARAGNITLVIPSLPKALESAQKLGVDFLELLDPYLRGNAIHVVATAHRGAFHKSMGVEERLAERFEEVQVAPAASSVLASLLLARAEELERRSGVFFSYPAIFATAESARQYFPYGSALDNAFDLLDELAATASPRVRGGAGRTIRREDVNALVKEKTGIPVGVMDTAERAKLLSLEELLGKRVLGQSAAVRAVAEALRRARAGLTKEGRPMGSFLFLGPTGVGKTETSKALAAALFDDEKRLLRLDMSEFNTADAVERLIGTPDGAEPGALARLLRDQPYGVLLLDEFEKMHPNALNIFLSVLDEGFFTDGAGKRVSAQNVIIVATSNAGSDFIFEAVERGEDPSVRSAELVDTLIERGTFKPELLNRFDGVIVFRPLGPEELRGIARILLAGLTRELAEKGVTIEITDEIVSFLAEKGFDPKFGARPMRRALQEHIEEPLARRLISGTLKPGTTLVLTREALKI